MGPESRPGQDSPDGGTLGDLLYGTGSSPVSEKHWVGLIQSIARGDQQALQTLYVATHRLVYTLSARITQDRQAGEEVTLDVFHEVWRRAGTYDPAKGSVIGWIMNQARSRALDRVRFEHRKKRVSRSGQDGLPVSASAAPPDTVDGWERGRRLRGALAQLTPNERQAIEMAFFSELTYAEVAAQLGQPVGTIKTRIRSGLEKLRQALARSEGP